MGLRKRIEDNVIICLLGAIIAGFGAGIGAYGSVLAIAKMEVVSRDRQQKYEMLLTKDRFLSLYLRYALDHLEPFKFEVSDEERQAAKEALDAYMQEYVDAADKSESLVGIGKGHGTQTTVTFTDGSQWVVPPGFRAATLD